jgi:electron-transferring-flavoprotein dehydrogenase
LTDAVILKDEHNEDASSAASASASKSTESEMSAEQLYETAEEKAAKARSEHVRVNVEDYAGLLGRACPAGVYEYVDAEEGEKGSWNGKKLVINSQVST